MIKYVYVTSARRNPEQNPVADRNSILEKYYQEDLHYKSPMYFVSFTDLLKVGINPVNKYGTPIGIYTYPLRYLYEEILTDDVPFAGSRPYIQIIKRNTKKILQNSSYKDNNYYQDIQKLISLFDQRKPDITQRTIQRTNIRLKEYGVNDKIESDNLEFPFVLSIAKTLARKSIRLNKKRTVKNINIIWCLTQVLSYLFSDGKKDSTVTWNSLFRYLGYELILDKGLGVIHSNEQVQAVFLIKSALKPIQVIDNKFHETATKDTRPEYLKKFSTVETDEEYRELLNANPSVRYLRGKKIKIGLDPEENRIHIYDGSLRNCRGLLRNMVIQVSTDNSTLEDCDIRDRWWSYPTEFRHCIIRKSNIKEVILSDSNISDSEVTDTLNYRCEFGNCKIDLNDYKSHVIRQKGTEVTRNTYSNCIIMSGYFRGVTFSKCEFLDKKSCRFEFCTFDNCKFHDKDNCTFEYCTFND